MKIKLVAAAATLALTATGLAACNDTKNAPATETPSMVPSDAMMSDSMQPSDSMMSDEMKPSDAMMTDEMMTEAPMSGSMSH
ncbi:hypothetical protein [Corynebacterium sp. SA-MJD20WY100]|uniref:hypothetical protein n=1 Tax=Corynebacterium sp. SA-MJD20WY100 TaxID=3142969 RepID=UPI0032214E17